MVDQGLGVRALVDDETAVRVYDTDDWHDVIPAEGERLDDDVELAVQQLVEPWSTSSNGRAEAVCVEGGVAEALGALGVRRARAAALDATSALAWLCPPES